MDNKALYVLAGYDNETEKTEYYIFLKLEKSLENSLEIGAYTYEKGISVL